MSLPCPMKHNLLVLLPESFEAFHLETIELIEKGWSGERKYRLSDAEGRAYLLRLSELDGLERKKEEFNYMMQLCELDLRMSKPLVQGILLDDSAVASLYTWVEGEDLDASLPALSEERQYNLGLEAGRILAKIHSLPVEVDREDWAEFFSRKIESKIKSYRRLAVKLEGAERVIDMLREGKRYLKGRPYAFHHGDFHAGNLLLSDQGELGVIDFNRFDFGDPWEEFNRIVWCAQASPRFAKGRVEGYFPDGVPKEFWPLLRIYIGSNMLGALTWAKQFGIEEEAVMLRQYEDVMRWYDQMERLVPLWML